MEEHIMRTGTKVLAALAVAALLAPGAFAQASKKGSQRIEGEIVQVRNTVTTQNEGEFTEIQVRTRQQQEQWVRLGRAEDMGDVFQVGDMVRIGMKDPGEDGPPVAHRIQNYRNGQTLNLRNADGSLKSQEQIRKQIRKEKQDGKGDAQKDQMRQRDRIHEPGTGGGTGTGTRRGTGKGGGRF
jgi:hypothetical protein